MENEGTARRLLGKGSLRVDNHRAMEKAVIIVREGVMVVVDELVELG